jgi:hypothetical protein
LALRYPSPEFVRVSEIVSTPAKVRIPTIRIVTAIRTSR